MGQKLKESRCLARSPVAWEVLAGELSLGMLRTRGWTEEISAAGCRILADETIEAGEKIRVLILADRRLMHLKGRVVRSSCLGDGEFELGVAFGNLSERNLGILKSATGRNRL